MIKKTKTLIADNSEINRTVLSDILAPGYEILEVSNGEEALAYLNRHRMEVTMALLDIIIPKLNGFEVLTMTNHDGLLNDIPVVIISSETSAVYIDHVYNLGAAGYTNRPFRKVIVRHRAESIIRLYAGQKHLKHMITEQILEKGRDNVVMVDVLGHIVEFRNGEDGLHVLHIRIITEISLKQLQKTCKQYHLVPARIAFITSAPSLHDIGKISIPERIPNKPEKLTPEESELIKTHSPTGAGVLEGLTYYQNEELVQVAKDIYRWHHERYDGSGYPDGLPDKQIPIATQAVSLADVYGALISERIHKKAYSHEQVLSIVSNGECGAFDPVLLDALKIMDSHLENEVKVRSTGKITRDNIHTLAYDTLHSQGASGKMLNLLEQEQTKYQFYASLTIGIQLEYNCEFDTLILSEWGAAQAGIRESILHPQSGEELLSISSGEDFRDLYSRAQCATPEEPIVGQVYQLNLKEERRWYKVVARPVRELDENTRPTKVIGKFIDNQEKRNALGKLTVQVQCGDLMGLSAGSHACEEIKYHLLALDKKKAVFLVLDSDTFKEISDSHSHPYGDKMLKAVTARLRSGMHNSDIVARIGGDEFLVHMEYEVDIEWLVERVFHKVPRSYNGFEVPMSINVALAFGSDVTYKELFLHADQTLYAGKHARRGQYRSYGDSMQSILLSQPEQIADK